MQTHHPCTSSDFLRSVKFSFLYATLLLISIPAHAEVFTPPATPSITTTNSTSAFLPICTALKINLGRNSTDLETAGAVTVLQNFLFERGYYSRSGVGEFGWLTFFAVAKFQEDHGLPATGFFGPMSRSYIYESTCREEAGTATIPTGTVSNGVDTITEIFPLPVATSTPTQETAPATTTSNLSLPYQSSPRLNEWRSDWGSVTTSPEGVLLLRATASTTGATVLLPGSEEWTDYSYTADVILNVNGSFSLLGRYTDTKNFLSCTFAGRYVSINQTLNGTRKQVASVRLPTSISSAILSGTNVRMEVNKNRISCSRTGVEDVIYTLSDNRLMKGGIGISNWFTVPGVSTLDLRSVKVDKI